MSAPSESVDDECRTALPLDRLGLYVHFPFCGSKCAYCDFNSVAGRNCLIDPYLRALAHEIREMADGPADWTRYTRVVSVYVGGGTPSLMTQEQLTGVLESLRASFTWAPETEVSVEANPGTVDLPKLRGYRKLGCNRISFGVQSFEPDLLRVLGRRHTAGDVAEAVKMARTAGFGNLSLDLIYGVPRQSRDAWRHSLEAAIALEPEHLSLYCLTLETGTSMERAVSSGSLETPDEEAAAEMYEIAVDVLATHGYEHYELSNWCGPGFECLHNLSYWECRPYFGFGAGAHSCLPTDVSGAAWRRMWNVRDIDAYVEQQLVGPAPQREQEVLDCRMAAAEYLMLGLRLIRGVDLVGFRVRFGSHALDLLATALEESARDDLVTIEGDHVRLTSRGLLLANEVSLRLVAAARES